MADQRTVEGIPTRDGLPWHHNSVRLPLKTAGRGTDVTM